MLAYLAWLAVLFWGARGGKGTGGDAGARGGQRLFGRREGLTAGEKKLFHGGGGALILEKVVWKCIGGLLKLEKSVWEREKVVVERVA